MAPHMRDIDFLAPGVEHQLQMRAEIGHHEVIDDASCLIKQQCVTLAAGFETLDVTRHQAFEARRIGDFHLAHMRDVEQGRPGTAGVMLGHDALVLQWHFIARKFNHARV